MPPGRKRIQKKSSGDDKKDTKKHEQYPVTSREVIEGCKLIETNIKCFAEWMTATTEVCIFLYHTSYI